MRLFCTGQMSRVACLLFTVFVASNSLVTPPSAVRSRPTLIRAGGGCSPSMSLRKFKNSSPELSEGVSDRRVLIRHVTASLLSGTAYIALLGSAKSAQATNDRPLLRRSATGEKIIVLGGNGFVGSKVCELLAEAGADVVSVSRSGSKPDKWAKGQSWVDKIKWTAGDPMTQDLSATFNKASAVISCIGVIGGSDIDMEKGNGNVNAAAASQAAQAKVGRLVYVSVSDLVPEAFGSVAFKGYFSGKRCAEDAVRASFPSHHVLIKPTFIYGGDSFGLTPPRVSESYGATIDALLSSAPVQAIAAICPAPIKVALSPPVSRDSVALACVAAALGRLKGNSFDGADQINAAAKQA